MTEHPTTSESRASSRVVSDFGPGTRVGNYRLLQLIGEGGFGSVWSAQQDVAVRRIVAVKILKLGMDTKQVVARFENERQALAVMDHPSIAKVLDGGATETGRPYFVMELVKGVPITRFCDDAKLSLRKRLELFREVCSAVQHAHQKGIIHRDLKPSNILVGLQDGLPQPKIIDFGVAKAVIGPLTDRTEVTEIGQMIGTPEFMAPEQADSSGLDVDTRADVYSLGVVLYEILTGTKPFELGTTLEKGYSELVRTIREVDPPRPSTRVSSHADGETFARQRGTSQLHLGRALRGDLDWIVIKAMEKDRSNRYATVAALAEDVERHLDNRPVLAAPPSAAHRVRKYVRRHRIGVAACAAVALSLIAGLVVSAFGYWEASAQRDAAKHAEEIARTEARRAEQVVEMLSALFDGANPYAGRDADYTLRELLDEFDSQLVTRVGADPEVEATVHRVLGRAYRGIGDGVKSGEHVVAAHDIRTRIDGPESVRTLETLVERVHSLHDAGEYAAAAVEARAGLEIARRVAPDSEVTSDLLYVLGNVVGAGTSPREAVPFLREALALRERLGGPNHEKTGDAMFALGRVLMDGSAEERAEAERLFLGRIAVLRVAGHADHPNIAMALDNLGRMAMDQGDVAAAERYLRDAIEIQRRQLGNEHPDLATSLCTLGNLRREAGALSDADAALTEAADIYRRRLGADHPDLGIALELHAIVKRDRGDLDGAQRMLEEACAIFRKRLELDHPDFTATLNVLASIQRSRGDVRGSEESYRELNRAYRLNHAPDSGEVTSSACLIAGALTEQAYSDHAIDKAREAETLLREVVAVRAATLGEADWRTAVAESQLADALAAQEKLDEACELAFRSYDRLSSSGDIPAAARAGQLRSALERGVRVLEAAARATPDSVDAGAITEWKTKLDELQSQEASKSR